MEVKRWISLLICVCMVAVSAPTWAQRGEKDNEISTTGPRKQLSTIIFAGLAGAVLGLSTLSFYGRPQDKLSNIAVGFAIGVIAGTMYSTYQAATKPKEFYGLIEPAEPELWALSDSLRDPGPEQTPSLGLTLTF